MPEMQDYISLVRFRGEVKMICDSCGKECADTFDPYCEECYAEMMENFDKQYAEGLAKFIAKMSQQGMEIHFPTEEGMMKIKDGEISPSER